MKNLFLFIALVFLAGNASAQCGTTVSSTNVLCTGFCNGSITFTPSIGTAPYYLSIDGTFISSFTSSYTWTAACTGIHHYVLTDTLTTCTDSGNVTVTEPPILGIVTFASPVTCHGGTDGVACVSVGGGTPPYSYDWGAFLHGVCATQPGPPNGLSAGTYNITVTDSNNCSTSAAAIVTEPTAVVAFASASVNVSCNGGHDGVATSTAIGGFAPYRYNWSPSGDSTSTVNNLGAGTHFVVVTDAAGCNANSNNITISQPPPITSITNATNISCPGGSDGSFCVIVGGGVAPYMYSADGGITFQASNCLTGLHAGNYFATVKDTDGCSNMNNVTILEPVPFFNFLSSANATCANGNDGNACITVSGGTPPYSYNWTTGDTSSCISSLTPLIYIVFITDGNSCFDSTGVVITQSPALSISNLSDVTCNGGTNGSACINATGGVLPYYYVWSSAATSQCATNLVAGYYVVNVTDTNGCSGYISLTINEPPPIIVNAGPDLLICSGTPTGLICANAFGGSQSYSYAWSTGPNDTLNCISNITAAGVITITVTDSSGCSASDQVIITVAPPVNISISSTAPSCGQCDGIATANAISAASYVWTPGLITTPTLNNFCPGTYIVTVTNVFGCYDTMSISFSSTQCDSVWPGDANYDGVANNFDILNLGVNYGTSGPARTAASNAWTGQVCANWANSSPGGINGKHCDCDGNDTVDVADTIPIYLNYGLMHPRMIPLPHQSSLPDLYLDADVDTIGPSQLLHVKIRMGSFAAPVPAIYGVAFTLTFDPSLVDTTTAAFDYSTSVLGTNGVDLLTFEYPFYSAGAIDVAVTRTSHTDIVNVDSIIGVFDVVITDNVSALNLLRVGISNMVAITYSQTPVALNARPDSVVIDPSFIGIKTIALENSISVYPSPARDQLRITSAVEIEKAVLMNELGETIISVDVRQKKFSINADKIKNGIYFLQLSTASGVVRKRVCVLK